LFEVPDPSSLSVSSSVAASVLISAKSEVVALLPAGATTAAPSATVSNGNVDGERAVAVLVTKGALSRRAVKVLLLLLVAVIVGALLVLGVEDEMATAELTSSNMVVAAADGPAVDASLCVVVFFTSSVEYGPGSVVCVATVALVCGANVVSTSGSTLLPLLALVVVLG
jgi:hypothetical protein